MYTWNLRNHPFQSLSATGKEMNQETLSYVPNNIHLLSSNDSS